MSILMITLLLINRNDQLSDTKESVTKIERGVESADHCSSGNDPDIVDKKQQPDSTLTRVC
jgi:hypothetical protein